MKCPNCDGTGEVAAPYTKAYTCAWCGGAKTITEAVLRPWRATNFAALGRSDRCCDKAIALSRQCVCSVVTWCPDHGRTHHGTHD